MKTILILILSACWASAATLYPLLTDNTNRTFSGGATNVARLDQSQTFTGINTLNAASLKASGVLSVVLVATNINWFGNVTGSASTPSSWANAAQVASIAMPAVITTNGYLRVSYSRWASNSVAASVYPVCYAGDAQTFVGASGGFGTSAFTNAPQALQIFANWGSFTNQLANVAGSQVASWTTTVGAVDTSTNNWPFYFGLSHSSGAGTTSTNINVGWFVAEWVFGP